MVWVFSVFVVIFKVGNAVIGFLVFFLELGYSFGEFEVVGFSVREPLLELVDLVAQHIYFFLPGGEVPDGGDGSTVVIL